VNSEGRQPASRPSGVTVLGVLLLVIGGAFLANCARVAIMMPAQLPGNIGIFMVAGVLPGLWASATGVGMLRARSWARASFFALVALCFVMVAGAISRGFETRADYARAGALTAVFLCMVWGVWYLMCEHVRAWFR